MNNASEIHHDAHMVLVPQKRKGIVTAVFKCSCGVDAEFKWTRNGAGVVEGGLWRVSVPEGRHPCTAARDCPAFWGQVQRSQAQLGKIRPKEGAA